MTEHDEPPPGALAHGPVKSGDIERVRRDVDESGARVAHQTKVAAGRREKQLRREAEQLRREAEQREDAES